MPKSSSRWRIRCFTSCILSGCFKTIWAVSAFSVVPVSYTHLDAQIREEGLDKVLEEAGFAIRQPGCSACLAMNDDKVPAGMYAVSTSNRNFEGRQGPGSRTLLASPLVAAAAAVTGVITDPRELKMCIRDRYSTVWYYYSTGKV